MEHTNGRDFGLYNTGAYFWGSTSAILQYAFRITCFNFYTCDACSSKDTLCEISFEGGSYAQTKQTYVRS